jgi:hypothetical protein
MKAAETSPSASNFSSPAAAILVALAGAALVAVGLLLIGVHDVQLGKWGPEISSPTALGTMG